MKKFLEKLFVKDSKSDCVTIIRNEKVSPKQIVWTEKDIMARGKFYRELFSSDVQ